jgi:hypothetical protein
MNWHQESLRKTTYLFVQTCFPIHEKSEPIYPARTRPSFILGYTRGSSTRASVKSIQVALLFLRFAVPAIASVSLATSALSLVKSRVAMIRRLRFTPPVWVEKNPSSRGGGYHLGPFFPTRQSFGLHKGCESCSLVSSTGVRSL